MSDKSMIETAKREYLLTLRDKLNRTILREFIQLRKYIESKTYNSVCKSEVLSSNLETLASINLKTDFPEKKYTYITTIKLEKKEVDDFIEKIEKKTGLTNDTSLLKIVVKLTASQMIMGNIDKMEIKESDKLFYEKIRMKDFLIILISTFARYLLQYGDDAYKYPMIRKLFNECIDISIKKLIPINAFIKKIKSEDLLKFQQKVNNEKHNTEKLNIFFKY